MQRLRDRERRMVPRRPGHSVCSRGAPQGNRLPARRLPARRPRPAARCASTRRPLTAAPPRTLPRRAGDRHAGPLQLAFLMMGIFAAALYRCAPCSPAAGPQPEPLARRALRPRGRRSCKRASCSLAQALRACPPLQAASHPARCARAARPRRAQASAPQGRRQSGQGQAVGRGPGVLAGSGVSASPVSVFPPFDAWRTRPPLLPPPPPPLYIWRAT